MNPKIINHIAEHWAKFHDHTGYNVIEEYFADFVNDQRDESALYRTLCADIGITPISLEQPEPAKLSELEAKCYIEILKKAEDSDFTLDQRVHFNAGVYRVWNWLKEELNVDDD
jgi:hypothetical protein